MQLSAFDQSIAFAGRPHAETIRNTIALAQHCEALGYRRFWVSEHHNDSAVASTAPEILIAAIAATTRRIRVGSAGVMLSHYSPFKVAEVFRVLDALAPGRIDMGLGRAPGSDRETALALNPTGFERRQRFASDVRELIAWVHDEPLPAGHPFARVKAYPAAATAPQPWILGSSEHGAEVAASQGLPYCYAWFFGNHAAGERAIELYRRRYRPSARHPEPRTALCVWALAAPTVEEARYHFTPRALSLVSAATGSLGPLAPHEAAAVPLGPSDRARLEMLCRDELVGTASQVAAALHALAARLAVDEVAVLTWSHDEAIRRQSYALLAEACGLRRSATADRAGPQGQLALDSDGPRC